MIAVLEPEFVLRRHAAVPVAHGPVVRRPRLEDERAGFRFDLAVRVADGDHGRVPRGDIVEPIFAEGM